ncbi:MAG: flagellar assembly protein FliW [Oscillospiraceae bacterium]|nr:flagellar assembly protein FliW [Oscillospiraceae bacterium]
MKINTKYFDAIETEQDDIIRFPQGIFGFEGNTDYVIIKFDDGEDQDDEGLFCLQSTTDESLAFVLLNPFYIDREYDPIMSDDDYRTIGKTAEEDGLVYYAIVVVKDNFSESTVNMKCPIVINKESRKAKQIILESDYSMKHPIMSPAEGGS